MRFRSIQKVFGYLCIPLFLLYPELMNDPQEVNISMLYMDSHWHVYMRVVSLFIIIYIMLNLFGKVKTNLLVLFAVLSFLTIFLSSAGSVLHSLHLLFANGAFALFVYFLFRLMPVSVQNLYVCILFTGLCVMLTDGHVSGTSELVIAIPSAVLFTRYAV